MVEDKNQMVEDKNKTNLRKIKVYDDGSKFDYSKNMNCYVSDLSDNEIVNKRKKEMKNKYYRLKYRNDPQKERERNLEKYYRIDKHKPNRNKSKKKNEEDKLPPGRKRIY
jgi:hypothetical protein